MCCASEARPKRGKSFLQPDVHGQAGAALDLLFNRGKRGVLQVSDPVNKDDQTSATVLDILKTKHLSA